jgi:hypothetical protein
MAGLDFCKMAPQLVQLSMLPGLSVPQIEQARGLPVSG